MKKLLLLALLAAVLGAFYMLGGSAWLTPATYQQWYAESPLASAFIYFVIYILMAALAIPGATLITLAAGAIFGFWVGLALVSFASSLGALANMLLARTLLRDWVQSKFGRYMERIDRGLERDGAFYLFGMRLIPLIPFFVINPVMGLTGLRAWTFYWVSQLGMLAGTAVYVNAGAELGGIEQLSASGILTPGLVGGFVLLAAFPFMARALMGALRRLRVYKGWRKPRSFDANLIVIGAGSAGLVASYICAAAGARVIMVERADMGGDCLNTGCVPSKALLRSAKMAHYMHRAGQFGIKAHGEVQFNQVMERIQRVVAQIAPHDSVERYQGLGVDVVRGEAEIISPWQVRVGDETFSARSIIIAAGAEPFVPPIEGIDEVGHDTSDSLWRWREAPQRLMLMGGGPIGCELAQAFARLGVRTTLVEAMPRIMPREDEDTARLMDERLRADGVQILTGHKAIKFAKKNGAKTATLEAGSGRLEHEFDALIVATGRRARSEARLIERLGLETGPGGTLVVDEYLRTRYPNIYACGDIAGPYQFTHTAAHQAWYASVNALFGTLRRFRVDYSVIPWVTYTDPEVATVGLTEGEAQKRGVQYEVTKYGLDDLDRAIADGEDAGFVKVLTAPGTDRILGATVVGYQAGQMLMEFVLAMRHGLGLGKILGTIHPYPTMAEGVKFAAGAWRRAHLPGRAMALARRWHSLWR